MAGTTTAFDPGSIAPIGENDCLFSSINTINGNFTNLITRNSFLAESKLSNPLKDALNANTYTVRCGTADNNTTQQYPIGTKTLYVNSQDLSKIQVGYRLYGIIPNPNSTPGPTIGTTVVPFSTTVESKNSTNNSVTLSKAFTASFTLDPDIHKLVFVNTENIKRYYGNILTWNPTQRSWDARPFQGYGELSARAWVVFDTTIGIRSSYNVSSVKLSKDIASDPVYSYVRPLPADTINNASQFFIQLSTPVETNECVCIASASPPSVSTLIQGCPEVNKNGIPLNQGDNPANKKKIINASTRTWPTPEELYWVNTTDQANTNYTKGTPIQIPEIYRNTLTVSWRSSSSLATAAAPAANSIISVIVYGRPWDPTQLIPNPATELLGMDLNSLR